MFLFVFAIFAFFLDNTNGEIFKKTILPIIQSRLESTTDNEVWTLPLGRTTAMKVKPFRLASLDAMTVQAKFSYVNCLFYRYIFVSFSRITNMLLVLLFQQLQPGYAARLPSPATIGTLVRLIGTSDCEYGLKHLLTMIPRTVSAANS